MLSNYQVECDGRKGDATMEQIPCANLNLHYSELGNKKTYQGTLRKQTKVSKLLAKTHLMKVFQSQWPYRHIALVEGCVYTFMNDKKDVKPKSAVSMYGYHKLVNLETEVSDPQYEYGFIVKCLQSPSMDLYFAAQGEDGRNQWMAAFREEMIEANKVGLVARLGVSNIDIDDEISAAEVYDYIRLNNMNSDTLADPKDYTHATVNTLGDYSDHFTDVASISSSDSSVPGIPVPKPRGAIRVLPVDNQFKKPAKPVPLPPKVYATEARQGSDDDWVPMSPVTPPTPTAQVDQRSFSTSPPLNPSRKVPPKPPPKPVKNRNHLANKPNDEFPPSAYAAMAQSFKESMFLRSYATKEITITPDIQQSGLFYIRESVRDKSQLTLCVHVDGEAGLRKFAIVKTEDDHYCVSTEKTKLFRDMDQLLNHYRKHPLPSKAFSNLVLTVPFRDHHNYKGSAS